MNETTLETTAASASQNIKSILQQALAGNPTKEQAAVAIAAIAGYVALQAIKNGYSFEYDHSNKSFSATAGKPARSWAWDEPNPHA